MLFGYIMGIIGNYFGVQRTKEIRPIVEESSVATVENELQIPAVWQCVSLISNTLKSLPIDVYEVGKNGQKTLKKTIFYINC
jgi:Phage portal protein.